jgi:hypothetical protein
LHFPEQNQRIVPSCLTYIMPVPAGKLVPQNEHFLGFGIVFCSVYLVIFFASRSVSLSMSMSWTLMGPLTFLEMMRPLSRPSRMRTRTCVISPVTPVRPMIWMTSEGISSPSAADFDSLLITEVLFSTAQAAL